jgi:uncharacterized phiE125 gp8 family phage protein
MSLIESVAPASEPVTRAEAALWMRYTGSLQNDVIDSLIKSARRYVELWTGRTLINTTWAYYTDDLYTCIKLPTGNVSSVTSIKYQDSDDVQQTLTSTLYGVDGKSVINQIYLKPNQSYPDVLVQPNAVEILFVAGYGATATSVPEDIKTAVKMMVAHCFEHREAHLMENLKENPAIQALLQIDAKYQGW